MKKQLSDLIKINRRYSRSINLDRDLEFHRGLEGYILTPKNGDITMRLLSSMIKTNSVRSWTITGLYGTGKSAFAHFLAGLCAPSDSPLNQTAIFIAKKQHLFDHSLYASFRKKYGKAGLILAATTAQREPISNTIIRALHRGIGIHWMKTRGVRPSVLQELDDAYTRLLKGKTIVSEKALDFVKRTAIASKSGILLILDELGKNLEHAAHNQHAEDLYILQQLAELPTSASDPLICTIGILHQSFADYGKELAIMQRNEWAKVQGRFEDLPFNESIDQMLRLVGEVIEHQPQKHFSLKIKTFARKWKKALGQIARFRQISNDQIGMVYPLHPISSIVLPIFCERFGQNDRSIFSFLTSNEPHSFLSFLENTFESEDLLPTLKLDQIYDYFVESSGMAITRHGVFQKWVEIQTAVSEAEHLGKDLQRLLKVVGVLNLTSQTGELRASRDLVALAMCDDPTKRKELKKWNLLINKLLDRRLITFRKQIDELRIWQGTDFDVDQALNEKLSLIHSPLAEILTELFPLAPVVAYQHSYLTGTFRYFERRFIDETTLPTDSSKTETSRDGIIYYWVGSKKSSKTVSGSTECGKPIILLCARDIKFLRDACLEYAALNHMEAKTPELLSDGVARKEVRQRLAIAKRILENAFLQSFSFNNGIDCLVMGEPKKVSRAAELNNILSETCDVVFAKGPRIRNELINRNRLTAQISKAVKELIEGMLSHEGDHYLGIDGYGPERTIFESLLRSTGIYSKKNGKDWEFGPPKRNSGAYWIWSAMEGFCLTATNSPKSLLALYDELQRPPYGAKRGIIPILLLAFLLRHFDDVSLYQDGSFIPVLKPEDMEILVKRPERFSIKHFSLKGLRTKLFKELGASVRRSGTIRSRGLRNATLLGIVKPLVKFVASLPQYTIKTEKLDNKTRAVRDCLLTAKEPDKLLFEDLPIACGLPQILSIPVRDDTIVRMFKSQLVRSLKILQDSFDGLLGRCQKSLHQAFSVDRGLDKLREHLRVRASYLLGICIEPHLRSFLNVAIDEKNDDKAWLRALVMIILEKPVNSWTDTDEFFFEAKLAGLARRFLNLEALQKETVANPGKGFVARRVVLTRSGGEEASRVLWTSKDSVPRIDRMVSEIVKKYGLESNSYLLQGILSSLLEKSLFGDEKEEISVIKEVERNKKYG